MKVTTELGLKQSLLMTTDIRLAIDMLAMSTPELEDLMNEELINNPCLEERHDAYASFLSADQQGAFDIALKTTRTAQGFQDALLQQLGEGRFNALETTIATMLIHSLGDDGILDDYEHVYQWINDELGVFPEWIESVRRRILDFEPIGCGAKSIHEAIAHQISINCQFDHGEFLVLLNLLKKNPQQKLSHSLLASIRHDKSVAELKMVTPRPSSAFIHDPTNSSFIIPDVSVTNYHSHLSTSLCKKPSTRWALAKKSSTPFLKTYYRRALFMRQALQFREHSLLVVAKIIVEQQAGWFIDKQPLKPLNLRDVAQLSGLHESTISRLSRGKYLICDWGSFELKHFFGQGITADGLQDELSTSWIKEQVTTMIAKENKSAPLSDQKICERLGKMGIPIARRTVSKYREKLNIPAKNERFVLLSKLPYQRS
jgi:RNA polymerase sigma-54 factor